MTDSRLAGWPAFTDYPHTEGGWNDFANAWLRRHRWAGMLSNVPIFAVEEYRRAMSLGRDNAWQETGEE